MESKIIILVVFLAVVVESSLAVKKSEFSTELAEIQSDGSATLKSFHALVDGYFDAMHLLANVSSGNRDYDAETFAKLKSTEKRLVADLINAWHDTQRSLEFISSNSSAITHDEDVELKSIVESVFTPFYVIVRGKSYRESLAAVNAIEKIAIRKVVASWIRIYNVFKYALSSEHLPINNAIDVITPKAIGDGRGAFSCIFAGFKILLLELYGKSQARSLSFSSAIETERNFARIYLTDEAHTKFALFQYTATARHLKDSTIIIDFIKIQVVELGINNDFESACESLFTTIIQLSENQVPTCAIETLSDKLSANLYPAIIGGVVLFSNMISEGYSNDGIDQTEVYQEVNIMASDITNAIKLTQKSQTCGVRIGIEILEKRVVTVAVNVFKQTFIAMENMVSSIGRDAVATIKTASKKASISINSTFTSIFTAVKILLLPNIVGPQPGYCDTDVSAIKIARDAAFAGVKKETLLLFASMRISRLYDYQKANGIRVPFSLLRTA